MIQPVSTSKRLGYLLLAAVIFIVMVCYFIFMQPKQASAELNEAKTGELPTTDVTYSGTDDYNMSAIRQNSGNDDHSRETNANHDGR